MGASFNQFKNHIWGPFLRDMVNISLENNSFTNIAAISTTKLETWVPISLSYDDEYPPFLGGI
jgi:hypothetical protein